MDKTKYSHPAFPQHPRQPYPEMGGMSLRDYFAAQALPSVILQCAGDGYRGPLTIEERFAANSYKLADAMLAEHRK